MNRMLSMLGLCMRAGRIISGEKACVQAIRSGGAYCALIDAAASENAMKAVRNACESHQVPLLRVDENALGDAIGKPGRMVAAVTDAQMADRIIKLGSEDPAGRGFTGN